jgi:hypothetical protein
MVLKRDYDLIFILFEDNWERELVLAMLKKLKVDYRIEEAQKRFAADRTAFEEKNGHTFCNHYFSMMNDLFTEILEDVLSAVQRSDYVGCKASSRFS